MAETEKSTRKSSWSLTQIGLIVSSILLIALIGSALYRNDAQPPAEFVTQTEPYAGSPARPASAPATPFSLPENVMQANFSLIDGKDRKLADYSGKILIVDLWATWCGPCRQEIPHLVKMAREYKDKGVEVIGLTTEDPESDTQVVREFSEQFKINYPIGWADQPLAAGLMNGRNGIPQTIIIGRDGKVRNHFIGFNPMISVAQMKRAIDKALAEG